MAGKMKIEMLFNLVLLSQAFMGPYYMHCCSNLEKTNKVFLNKSCPAKTSSLC